MPLPAQRPAPASDREVDAIVRALRERGASSRSDLGRAIGAKQWGPGRFSASLRIAQEQGQARRTARARYEASRQHAAGDGGRDSGASSRETATPAVRAAPAVSDGSHRGSELPRTQTGNASRGG
jgi:hypothetical protein